LQTTSNYSPKKVFWSFDSEFLQSGRANRPEDTSSCQFSNGDKVFVIESAGELKTWLDNHHHVKRMYSFVLLPELGSLISWLGKDHVTAKYVGAQLQARVTYRGFNCWFYDTRPLLNSFGLYKLEDCGRCVGIAKLDRPTWLGLRHAQSELEHQEFVKYAGQDAVITSKIARWLYENFGIDAARVATSGTWSKHEFRLPKRLELRKKTAIVPPLERMIKNVCYAGRSECFVNGFTENVVYNDCKSLYPTSIAATRALQILGAEPCMLDEVVVGDDKRFGWLEGSFEANNDLWGLPLRGKNNFYATGIVSGLYHSFDLAAAKARPLFIARAFKPVFSDDTAMHDKYTGLLLRRLEGQMNNIEKMGAKALLNSTYGKLGQAIPVVAPTSNFFAFSTILAHSHFTMSRLFDRCHAAIVGTDTDSIFSTSDMAGKHFELTDGENGIPIILDVKGRGDLVYFRSKNYILLTKEQQSQLRRAERIDSVVFGRHGWQYFKEDFFKLFDGTVTELHTRRDIKHTLATREKDALQLEIGRWRTRPETLDLARLKELLRADTKRKRATYDSYDLVMQRKSSESRAWSMNGIIEMQDDMLAYPRIMKKIE
jgi:hypothetical protein